MHYIMYGFLCLCLSFEAFAQNSEQDLKNLTIAEKKARAEAVALEKKRETISSEISNLQKSLKKIAKETRVYERDARSLAEKKRIIDINIARLQASITTNQKDLQQLLSALQRLEATPPPALVVRPDDAIASAQTSQLMASLTQQLNTRTEMLKVQLTAFSQEQKLAQETQTQIDATAKQLQNRRVETVNLVSQKSELRKLIDLQRAEKQAAITKLAKEAATLKELLERLKAESIRVVPRLKPGIGKTGKKPSIAPLDLPDGIAPFAKAKGRLNLPVEGKLVKRYGSGEKGLTFSAQSQGQVLSPYAGRVEFAGPFKNYDQVVILSVGDGYYLLMTGLGKVYSQTGEVVSQGEAIGIMPYNNTGEDKLYLELRKDGKTLDPSPWLAL